MADFATLYLQLKNQQFNRGIDNSSQKVKSFGIGAGKVTALLGIMSTAMVFMGKKAVDAASDAQEVSDKFGTVFEGAGDKAEKTAKQISKSYGIAISTSKELLSSTGDILSGFGFTDKKALELSKRVTQLGSDLASFSNIEGGTKKAVTALTKALVGETEGAKILGVVIRQDSKEFKKLVEEGMNLRGETLLQAKAQAALTIATSQSQKAIGDTQRTWGSYANSTKRVNERIKALKESFGKVLIEGLELGKMVNNLGDDIKDLTKLVNKNGAAWVFVFRTWAIEVKTAMKQSWAAISWLFDNSKAVLDSAKKNILSFYTWYKKSLKTGEFSDTAGAVFDDILSSLSDFGEEFVRVSKFFDKQGEAANVSIGYGLISGFAALGKETDKVLRKYNRTLVFDKPNLKSLEDLSKTISQIEGKRAKAQRLLFKNALENAGKIGKLNKKNAEDTAKTMGTIGGAQRFTEAVFAGTVEAQKRELGQISSSKATENNTQKTATATNKIAKSNEKIAQNLTKPPVFVMA